MNIVYAYIHTPTYTHKVTHIHKYIYIYQSFFLKNEDIFKKYCKGLQSPGDITWPCQWLYILPQARYLDCAGLNFHFSKIVGEEGMGL